MTPLEEMLRHTLADTPTATTTADPLALLDGRVRRARRRLVLTAGGVAAAVAAAVVVPLATVGGGHPAKVQIGESPSPTPTATQPAPEIWVKGVANGVAANDARGHVFVVERSPDDTSRALVELDDAGNELRRAPVPSSSLFAAHREGTLWVWGGGDGGAPRAQVTSVDIKDGTSATLDLGTGQTVNDLAIGEGGDAWAVGVDRVLHLTMNGGHRRRPHRGGRRRNAVGAGRCRARPAGPRGRPAGCRAG